MSSTTKWICACFLLISFHHSTAQSLADLAKMAGIDLKEIGAEHLSDPSASSSSSASSLPTYPFRPPPIAGMMGNMNMNMNTNTPFGGFSSPFPTFPGFEGNNFGFGLNDGLAAAASSTNETAKNGTTTKKPSCGGCGKPGCPECAGKLGIGMTPPSEFGGFPMATGNEGEGGFGGFESFQGAGAEGFDGGFGAMSSAFQPSMNGFGGAFGGYGASAASFMNPATFVPFAAAHSILSNHGLTDGTPVGYEGYGGEVSQINPGFNMPFSPYPMRGGRGGRSRGRPSREPDQDYNDQPPRNNYDRPSQEQGYDGPSQDAPDEKYNNDHRAPSYNRPQEYDNHQPQYQRGPPSEQEDRHHGPPPPPPSTAGRYEYDQ